MFKEETILACLKLQLRANYLIDLVEITEEQITELHTIINFFAVNMVVILKG